jgi:HSP20 family protein
MLETRTPTLRRRLATPAREARGVDPLDTFHRELDRLVGQLLDGDIDTAGEPAVWQPRIDVREGDDEIVVSADLPGVKPEDVDLSVRDDRLTLQGRREETRSDEGDGWHRRERVTGGFSRTIRLPFEIDADRVEAKSAEGVLEVHVPKPAAQRETDARRIPIAHGEGAAG